jgi:hypothetical protein
MSSIHPDALDAGLSVLTNATSTALHITAAQQTTRANVLSNSLGNKASPTIGAPAARTPSGRRITVSAISDGAVTATGTAGFWQIIDGSRVLASGPLASTQAVTANNIFTLTAFDIGIPAVGGT